MAIIYGKRGGIRYTACVKCGLPKLTSDSQYKKLCPKCAMEERDKAYPKIIDGRKTCVKCGQNKPLSEFCKTYKFKSGYDGRCKDCRNEYLRERYADNIINAREKAAKRQRKRYQTSPESVVTAVKKWQRKNPNKVSEQHSRSYQRNSENYKTRARERRLLEGKFGDKRISAKEEREILIDSICPYCGKKINHKELDHIVPLTNGGLDEVGNATVACRTCNRSKRNKSLLQFLYYLLVKGDDRHV